MIITIDGYSWLGKTYTSKLLAKKMNINFLPTGILVRFVASQYAKNYRITSDDSAAIERAMYVFSETSIDEIKHYDELYEAKTEQGLKAIAKHAFITPIFQKRLQEYVIEKNIIMDGHITFSMFPNANRRYYFISSVSKRAELVARIKDISMEEATKYIKFRDSFEEKLPIPPSVHMIDPFSYQNHDELLTYLLEDIKRGK